MPSRTHRITSASVVVLAASLLVLSARSASSNGQTGALVRLQASSPGTAQVGHLNINGFAHVGKLASRDAGFTHAVKGLSYTGSDANIHPGGAYWPGAGEFAGPNGVIGASSENGGAGVVGLANSSSGYAGIFTNNGGGYGAYINTTGTSSYALYASGGLGTYTSRLTIGSPTGVGFPQQFAADLGDKVSFWGASGAHYGIGVQSGLLQIHSDVSASDVAFGHGSSAAFTETMRVKGNGNVGIGTSTPLGKLHVRSGNTYLDTIGFGGTPSVDLAIGDTDTGFDSGGDGTLNLFANNVNLVRFTTTVADFRVAHQILNGAGTPRLVNFISGDVGQTNWGSPTAWRGLYSGGSTNGDMYMGALNNAGNGFIGGIQKIGDTTSIWGTSKSFVEVNPDDPSTDIVYTCLEGPEAAMYCRGTGQLVNGRARIDLPDHFRALAEEGSLTVILTPISYDSKGLAIGKKSLSGVEVGELAGGTGNYEFDWEVKAVRSRFNKYEVVRPWTNRLAPDSDREKAWKDRLESIERDRTSQNGGK